MNIKNGDMPANPLRGANNVPFSQADYGGISNMMMGLSKREAFAMAAMQGLCANSFLVDKLTDISGVDVTGHITKQAIKQADDLLKELSK